MQAPQGQCWADCGGNICTVPSITAEGHWGGTSTASGTGSSKTLSSQTPVHRPVSLWYIAQSDDSTSLEKLTNLFLIPNGNYPFPHPPASPCSTVQRNHRGSQINGWESSGQKEWRFFSLILLFQTLPNDQTAWSNVPWLFSDINWHIKISTKLPKFLVTQNRQKVLAAISSAYKSR